jgi:YVTN family beta-propeller protein
VQTPGPGTTSGNVTYFGIVYNSSNVTTLPCVNPSCPANIAAINIPGAEVPASWNFDFDWPYGCGYANLADQYTEPSNPFIIWWRYYFPSIAMQNNTAESDTCIIPASGVSPASTNFAIVGSFPGSITLAGQAPFITEFGMPILSVYNQNGSLVATETATSVSSGGATATFPFPSSLAGNSYQLIPQNQINETPGSAPAGENFLSVATSQTIAGNPYGVSVGGQTDITVTCVYVPTPPYGGHNQCTSTSAYAPVPVVSLYSAGQVLVNGTTINVGPNPTAVLAYPASAVSTTNGNVTVTKADTTRAIVANSGSNTVTILDIVNNVALATVTVGNQPVALVTTSNGSYAYVANYTDGTVTPVNLSTNTAGTAVAVGGHPTSVALSSGGILWVGGAGFLTEINTSNMTVVGTESVSGKTITSLGYSDAYNNLLVSSVDTSGNVYDEVVAASSFVAGGSYTPAASQVVSSAGTYLNPTTNTNVQGYTATLAKAGRLKISPFQPGAPPLVVQDDWMVVSSTPTGFAVSIASTGQVLISQTTPSPVTAISVDMNLQTVYLTEPDSNTLLTVPLPGVN